MRRLRLLALLAVTSCAGPTGPIPAQLAADQGLVEVRVVSNLGFSDFWTFTVKSDSDGKAYELRHAPQAVHDSRIFVGALPAGRYSPTELYGSHTSGGFITTVTVTLGSTAGSFRVAPGAVTNLGTVIYQPGGDAATDSGSGWLLHDPAPVSTRALLGTEYAALATAVAKTRELGWEVAPHATDHARLRKEASRTAQGLNGPTFDASGAIYAGARLGTVLVRERGAQRWQALDTGSVSEVLTVLPLSRGRLLAGGEEGLLAYSNDNGRSWRRLSLVPPTRMVIFLGSAPNGDLYLVAQGYREIVVYSSKSPDAGWRELRRFGEESLEGSIWIGAPFGTSPVVLWDVHQPRDRVGLSKTRLVVYVHPYTLWSYEFASGRWEASERTPQPLYSVQVAPEGYVFGVPLGGTRMYGTPDFGRTWQKLEYFTMAIPPVFTSRSTGYMGAKPYGFEDMKLMKTTDGGANWNASAEFKGFYPQRFAADASGRNLMAVTASSEVYLSSDEGKTWRLAQ